MKILFNRNSQIALQSIENKGFVELEDLMQLSGQYPEVWMISANILNMRCGQDAYAYIKYHELEPATFIPALIKGLEEMYKNTTIGAAMQFHVALNDIIASFTKKDVVWMAIIGVATSAVAFLIRIF